MVSKADKMGQGYVKALKPHVVDQIAFMKKHDRRETTLVEAANALMLDIDNGTYPYVTSSCTGIGGAVQGLSLDPSQIKHIIGIVKAYTTRVGSGPFPSEQINAIGEQLQAAGREWGVTTGRRRRCGWLDLVLLRYSTAVNHYTALNLTKLDVLDGFDEIRVATAYHLDGRKLESFPASVQALERAEVVYDSLPGWKANTMGAKRWEDLPVRAREYIEYIEREVGVPVKWIGTGPDRDHMIVRE